MKRLVESFNNAIEGFVYVLKTQRNMRIHFLMAFLALFIGVYMNLLFYEAIVLCTVIAVVLLAEMFNTVVELMIDLMKDTYHPLARMAKDVAAGAVLIASVNAIVVGYLIFSRHTPFQVEDAILQIKQSPWNMTLLVVMAVLGLTILGKLLFHRGTPFRGGMPSGHAAIAFAMWTIVTLFTGNVLMILITLVMAIMIARSRVSLGIHTFWEVIAGSVLGTATTILIFQLFRL